MGRDAKRWVPTNEGEDVGFRSRPNSAADPAAYMFDEPYFFPLRTAESSRAWQSYWRPAKRWAHSPGVWAWSRLTPKPTCADRPSADYQGAVAKFYTPNSLAPSTVARTTIWSSTGSLPMAPRSRPTRRVNSMPSRPTSRKSSARPARQDQGSSGLWAGSATRRTRTRWLHRIGEHRRSQISSRVRASQGTPSIRDLRRHVGPLRSDSEEGPGGRQPSRADPHVPAIVRDPEPTVRP